MNRNRRPGSGQITARLRIVRAGHGIAARGATCRAATPTAASWRDNTAKDLQYQGRDSDCPAKAQRIQLRPVPARHGPGLLPLRGAFHGSTVIAQYKGIGDRERIEGTNREWGASGLHRKVKGKDVWNAGI